MSKRIMLLFLFVFVISSISFSEDYLLLENNAGDRALFWVGDISTSMNCSITTPINVQDGEHHNTLRIVLNNDFKKYLILMFGKNSYNMASYEDSKGNQVYIKMEYKENYVNISKTMSKEEWKQFKAAKQITIIVNDYIFNFKNPNTNLK